MTDHGAPGLLAAPGFGSTKQYITAAGPMRHESLYCWTVVRPWAAKVNDIKLYFRQ